MGHVNREEEESEGNKRKTRTGVIKVLVIIHKRTKKINPSIAWFMFHHIYLIYSGIKNK